MRRAVCLLIWYDHCALADSILAKHAHDYFCGAYSQHDATFPRFVFFFLLIR